MNSVVQNKRRSNQLSELSEFNLNSNSNINPNSNINHRSIFNLNKLRIQNQAMNSLNKVSQCNNNLSIYKDNLSNPNSNNNSITSTFEKNIQIPYKNPETNPNLNNSDINNEIKIIIDKIKGCQSIQEVEVILQEKIPTYLSIFFLLTYFR